MMDVVEDLDIALKSAASITQKVAFMQDINK